MTQPLFYKCTSTAHAEFTCVGNHLLLRGTRKKFPFTQWCEPCQQAFPQWKEDAA